MTPWEFLISSFCIFPPLFFFCFHVGCWIILLLKDRKRLSDQIREVRLGCFHAYWMIFTGLMLILKKSWNVYEGCLYCSISTYKMFSYTFKLSAPLFLSQLYHFTSGDLTRRDMLGSDQGLISSTFYEQLLHPKIPKVLNDTDDLTVFFALLISVCIKAACKTLAKLTPDQSLFYSWIISNLNASIAVRISAARNNNQETTCEIRFRLSAPDVNNLLRQV